MKLLAARVDGSAVVAVRHWRRLLRLLSCCECPGEPAEKLMLFNGNTKDGLVAIGPLKDSASRARSSAAAPKGASVTSLPDYKRYVKTQYTIALNKNGGKCDKDQIRKWLAPVFTLMTPQIP